MFAVLALARIASLNLCADQLVVALADRRDIVAVTRFATDPALSAAADAAKGLRTTGGHAEDLLALDPDLVFVAPYQVAPTSRLLPRARIVAVPDAATLPEIEANIATVAAASGHPERGQALVASIRASLPPPATRPGPVAAYYQRGGWLTGTGTLVDDMMRRAGLTNLATVLHRPPLSRLGLEEIIAAKPDLLVLERRPARADRGSAMLEHPALVAAFPQGRRVYVAEALTVCGGPGYARGVMALRPLP